jgi:hypothetical protein
MYGKCSEYEEGVRSIYFVTLYLSYKQMRRVSDAVAFQLSENILVSIMTQYFDAEVIWMSMKSLQDTEAT